MTELDFCSEEVKEEEGEIVLIGSLSPAKPGSREWSRGRGGGVSHERTSQEGWSPLDVLRAQT